MTTLEERNQKPDQPSREIVVHPSGRPCTKWNKPSHQTVGKSTKDTVNESKLKLKVTTAHDKPAVIPNNDTILTQPVISHRSVHICSKQATLQVATKVKETQEMPPPHPTVPRASTIRHPSGCKCSKQIPLNVATDRSTTRQLHKCITTPSNEATEHGKAMTNTQKIIHLNGRPCSKEHSTDTGKTTPPMRRNVQIRSVKQ